MPRSGGEYACATCESSSCTGGVTAPCGTLLGFCMTGEGFCIRLGYTNSPARAVARTEACARSAWQVRPCIRYWFIALVAGMSLVASLVTGTAVAQPAWQVMDGDTPVWVRVVSATGVDAQEPAAESAWYEYGNTTSDTYLFSVGEPSDVRLVLRFRTDADGLTAEFFLHQGGALPLDYELNATGVTVLSHDGHPQVRVVARDLAWVVDGLPSFNLDVEIDRAGRLGPRAREITPDGRVDTRIRVWGVAPGTPAAMTRTLVNDPFPGDAYGRFGAAMRMPGAPAFRMAEPWMPTFPLFEIGSSSVDWYRENPIPISFDPRSMQLRIRSFVGFHTAGMYQISSNQHPPLVDFESPFVFLNFLPESRQPQVVVRNFMFPADTPFGEGERHLGFSNVRFSWKTDSETRWRYNLHLSDAFAFHDEIRIGDTIIRAVDGPSLPSRLMERDWAQVTFVEATRGFPGSEGVYFFNPVDTDSPGGSDYLRNPTLPNDTRLNPYSARGLPPGFRGQYRLEHAETPTLYVSPLDGAVHLRHAQGGAWHLGDGLLLRYHNLDGGPYIDGWTLEQANTVDDEGRRFAAGSERLEALFALPGHLVYGDASSLRIKQTTYTLAATDLTPPTDADSWESFRATVAPLAPRDPTTLDAWLEPFSGNEVRLDGFALRDARVTQAGFELVLEDVGAAAGALAALGIATETAWPITVLSYETATGEWSAAPGSPPGLAGGVGQVALEALSPTVVPMSLTNTGSLSLQGHATLTIGGDVVAEWPSFELRASERRDEALPWVPRMAGTYSVILTVADASVDLGTLEVPPAGRFEAARRAWFGLNDTGPAGVTLLITALLASLGTVALIARRALAPESQA